MSDHVEVTIDTATRTVTIVYPATIPGVDLSVEMEQYIAETYGSLGVIIHRALGIKL